MEYKVIEVNSNNEKAEFASVILHKLVEWLGVEKNIQKYINNLNECQCWAAFDNDECIGIFFGRIFKNGLGDVYIYGIDPKYHRKGIGALLYNKVEEYFKKNGCESVMVNTINGIGPNGDYKKTREFFKKFGFNEMLTTLNTDYEEYLVMMKSIKANNKIMDKFQL